jgi:hypothetical protein
MKETQDRSWWRRPARMIPLAVVALVVIGIVGSKLAAKSGLSRELAAARAKGLPTNPKELDAWYAAVPAAENAALKVMEAQGHQVFGPKEIEEFDLRAQEGERLDPLLMVRLEEHLRKNEPALKLLHEAAELTRSRYPMDLAKAPEVLFPHLLGVKRVTGLLRWEAVFCAERGDTAGTVKALRSGFAVAGTLEEPLLISELVRIACVSVLLPGLERVVSMARFQDEELTQLSVAVRNAEESCPKALHRALAGERAFANTGKRYTFEEYEQMGVVVAPFGGGGSGWMNEAPDFVRKFFYDLRSLLGLHDRDMSFYMRGLGRLINASDEKDFFAATERTEVELTSELAEHPYVYMQSGMSLPAMFGVPDKEVQLMARLRCARIALEMERVRARTGKLPKAEELVPVVFPVMPSDPIDGKALVVRPLSEGKGYEVVAVGTEETLRKKASPNGMVVRFRVIRAQGAQ